MERINEKTPSGGDYSEAYYFDSENKPTDDKDSAHKVIIRECMKNGDLVRETIGFCKGGK